MGWSQCTARGSLSIWPASQDHPRQSPASPGTSTLSEYMRPPRLSHRWLLSILSPTGEPSPGPPSPCCCPERCSPAPWRWAARPAWVPSTPSLQWWGWAWVTPGETGLNTSPPLQSSTPPTSSSSPWPGDSVWNKALSFSSSHILLLPRGLVYADWVYADPEIFIC